MDAAVFPVEFLDGEGGEEASAFEGLVFNGVLLFVGDDGRGGVALEDVRSEPIVEGLAGGVVSGIGTDCFGRCDGEVDGDDVVGVAGEKVLFGLFIENIVRRGDF